MKEPLWLDRADCLAIHETMLAQYGGLAGVRDDNMLESAIARPHHLFAYGSPTLAGLAAAYAAGIIRNHPFLDGNKRTGFMAGMAFLELNGLEFTAPEVDAVVQTLALAAGALDEAGYAAWLKKNSRRRAKSGRGGLKARPTGRATRPKRS
jgi:death on curing protein